MRAEHPEASLQSTLAPLSLCEQASTGAGHLVARSRGSMRTGWCITSRRFISSIQISRKWPVFAGCPIQEPPRTNPERTQDGPRNLSFGCDQRHLMFFSAMYCSYHLLSYCLCRLSAASPDQCRNWRFERSSVAVFHRFELLCHCFLGFDSRGVGRNSAKTRDLSQFVAVFATVFSADYPSQPVSPPFFCAGFFRRRVFRRRPRHPACESPLVFRERAG